MGEGKFSRDKWLVGSLILFILIVGGIFLAATLRRESGESDDSPSRASAARKGTVSHEQIKGARETLIRELLKGLEAASGKADRAQTSEWVDGLVREGEAAVPLALESLKKTGVWNFRVALLDVFARIRTASSLSALEGFFATLQAKETALKIEIVRRMSRMGGSLPREALTRILGNEANESVRGEIAKALVALGLTPEETAKLQKRDREVLESQVKVKAEQRSRITTLEKLDPRTETGLAELRKPALEESTVAIALLAFQKLEERGDGKAAEVLSLRVKAKAETNEAKIIQTNALAALTRMKASEARLAVKDVALGEDESLRIQAVDLLGGYGDPAMIPLLEQAVLKDKSDRMAKAVERARVSIEARKSAEGANK